MSSALLSLCFGDSASGGGDGGSGGSRLSSLYRVSGEEVDITPVSAHDADIVARLRSGDADALDEIMLERFSQLTRFADSILHDRAASEDIVQDIFTRLWAQRESLKISSLKAYLYTSVRNAALNIVKGQATRARSEEPLRSEIITNLESRGETIDEDPRITIIRAALDTLPERRRTALQLRYEQELSYPEVASILGISVNATQQLVFHALQSLRKVLSDLGSQGS